MKEIKGGEISIKNKQVFRQMLSRTKSLSNVDLWKHLKLKNRRKEERKEEKKRKENREIKKKNKKNNRENESKNKARKYNRQWQTLYNKTKIINRKIIVWKSNFKTERNRF